MLPRSRSVGFRLFELRGGVFVLAFVVEQASAHELRHRQRGIRGVSGLGMPRRGLGVLVRERDACGHLVRGRERAHVLVLGQRNRHVGLLAREHRLARAHQRIGKRHGAGCGIRTQLTDSPERLSRLVQTSHAQQQCAQLIVDRGELWLRLDDCLQSRECRPSISSGR